VLRGKIKVEAGKTKIPSGDQGSGKTRQKVGATAKSYPFIFSNKTSIPFLNDTKKILKNNLQ
jgi:hypothetical protein